MMEHIFTKFVEAFSIEYIFTVILATYLTIKLIETLYSKMPLPTWVKKVTTIVIGLLSFGVFVWLTDIPMETMLSSYFAALFLYDYAIKWLLEKFNVNYRKKRTC